MAEITKDFFFKLHELNKREKLHIIQFLVEELSLAEETEDVPLKSNWPANYFEETYGALRDDPLARPEQGTFEIREELA
jgi:hypothetical protein